jgi:hypothetical protein
MTGVTDADLAAGSVAGSRPPAAPGFGLVSSLAVAAVAAAGLAFAARAGAVALLVVVAAVQALLTVAWTYGASLPGRRGGLVIAALAAGGADTAASVWPHGRLGALVAVLGLALPVLFVHELARGAARVHVVASLSAVAALVLSVVALAAFLQLRHEFAGGTDGGRVVAAAVGAVGAALIVGYLVDLVAPVPRFDADVPRGLLGVVAAAVVGGAVGALLLRGDAAFGGGRSVFVGAALGALAGLLAIGAAFSLHGLPEPVGAARAQLRPVLAALLPLSVLAPVAFLLCLAIRT